MAFSKDLRPFLTAQLGNGKTKTDLTSYAEDRPLTPEEQGDLLYEWYENGASSKIEGEAARLGEMLWPSLNARAKAR
jgi:hypothetical protein